MNVNPETICNEWDDLRKSLMDFTGRYKKIYLYGAGKIGLTMKYFLNDIGILPSGFLVSEYTSSVHCIENVSVLTIKGFEKRDDIGIILSLSTKHHLKIKEILTEYGIIDVFVPSSRMYKLISVYERIITDRKAWELQKYFSPKIPVNRISLTHMHNILLIAPENIGDVIMFLPFARELRRNCCKNAKITAVVLPAVSSFMDLCPYVDKVIVYDIKNNNGLDVDEALVNGKKFAKKYLQKEYYDVVFLEGWYNIHIEHLFLMMFSNSKIRIGFSENNMPTKKILNQNFDKFLSVAIRSDEVMHEVTRNLLMLSALGGEIQSDEIEFWHTDTDEKDAEDLLMKAGCNREYRMIAVVPHANDKRRMWDEKKYVELLSKLHKEYSNLVFLILGNAQATSVGELLVKKLPSGFIINLTGRTSIGLVSAILKRCSLYIGSNTGLTHIAAAWKVPVVEIICNSKVGDPLEYSSPYRYHAWHTKNVSVQPDKPLPGCGATCYSDDAHCINQIKVVNVLQAVREMEVL